MLTRDKLFLGERIELAGAKAAFISAAKRSITAG